MARKKQITNEQLIEALYKCGGIYSQAARQLGISRQAIYKRINNNPQIAKVYEDTCEETLDLMENELIKLAKDGHFHAIKFYLKTKGRKRGYTEKAEPVDTGEITAYIKHVPLNIEH